MIANLKCSKHPKKTAIYICTHSQCVENCLCLTCIPTHNGNHSNRLLVMNDTFTDEDSLYNIVKTKQSERLNELDSIIKENESFISKKISEIEKFYSVVIKDAVDLIEDSKRKTIADFNKSWSKENNIDKDTITQIYKNLLQVKMEEETDISVIVKKIQLLEDELLPISTKKMKEINIQKENQEKTAEKFTINPKYWEVFSNKLKVILNETDVFNQLYLENTNLEKLCKISFNTSLLDLTNKELIVSSPTKLEADILHKFDKIIIENGGNLSINPWNGNKGGRLILICNSLIIKPNGILDISALGYLGGIPNTLPNHADSGESYNGKGTKTKEPNYGGGGGGPQDSSYGSCGGGGGGYGTKGDNSQPNTYGNGNREGGKGGLMYGDEEMKTIYMGSGGGAGAPYQNGTKAKGGNGGGIVVIVAVEFNNEGKIVADGGNGEDANGNTCGSGGGGGSGGSVFVVYSSLICKGEISVKGGNGGEWGNYTADPNTGSRGGKGGLGRIMFENCEKINKLNIFGLKF